MTYINVCLLTIALGRQVDKSTSRQVDKSTSRQIDIAKIFKWIGRYSPNGSTRIGYGDGSSVMSTSVNRQVDKSTGRQVDKSV